MKTLITYSSKTGNTKKVAEAILTAIPNAELKDINDVLYLDYDLIILGGWIDRATFDSKSLNFAKKLKKKKVAYFFTLGAHPNSDHSKDCVNNIETLLVENNNEIIGKYFCQGAIDPKLISWMSTLPTDHKMHPSEERKQRWKDAASHPNNFDLENTTKTFIEIYNKLKSLS